MKTEHISDEMLQQFLRGELGPHLTLAIAEHCDACELCSERRDQLDDLHLLFAQTAPPPIPSDLTDQVFAHVQTHVPVVANTPRFVPVHALVGVMALLLAGLSMGELSVPKALYQLPPAQAIQKTITVLTSHADLLPIPVAGFALLTTLSALGAAMLLNSSQHMVSHR